MAFIGKYRPKKFMSSNIRINRICEHCGEGFEARTLQTRYCSHRCNSRDYKKRKRQEKLEKVNEQNYQQKRTQILSDVSQLRHQEYFSVNEAAAYIGISRRTIYRLIQNNSLKVHKVGNRTIIKKSSIEYLFD